MSLHVFNISGEIVAIDPSDNFAGYESQFDIADFGTAFGGFSNDLLLLFGPAEEEPEEYKTDISVGIESTSGNTAIINIKIQIEGDWYYAYTSEVSGTIVRLMSVGL